MFYGCVLGELKSGEYVKQKKEKERKRKKREKEKKKRRKKKNKLLSIRIWIRVETSNWDNSTGSVTRKRSFGVGFKQDFVKGTLARGAFTKSGASESPEISTPNSFSVLFKICSNLAILSLMYDWIFEESFSFCNAWRSLDGMTSIICFAWDKVSLFYFILFILLFVSKKKKEWKKKKKTFQYEIVV